MPELGKEISFEQCIDEMAQAGFVGSEVGNKYPKDPKVLAAALKPRGLSIASAWFSSLFTTKDPEETYEAFIKHRDFSMPWVPKLSLFPSREDQFKV